MTALQTSLLLRPAARPPFGVRPAPAPPQEVHRVLRGLCQQGFTQRQLQILGACALGYTSEQIAASLYLSRPTVFRHIELLADRIFAFTDFRPTRYLLDAWTHLHRGCCTAPVWQMIDNDQLFATDDQLGLLPHPKRSTRPLREAATLAAAGRQRA